MNKPLVYENIYKELKGHIDKYDKEPFQLSLVAKMQAVVTAIRRQMPELVFVGFYTVEQLYNYEYSEAEKGLVIGPNASSTLPTPFIRYGKGVCGTAWKLAAVQVENDISVCKNYITCSSATKSEIVVPVFDKTKRVIAVLDIDSKVKGAFGDDDRAGLVKIVSLL